MRSKKSIDKKLDEIWSEVIKLNDGKCQYCSRTDTLNAHHIFSRRNYSTRWDIENGITLCAGHHTLSSKFSAHQTPIEFTYWLEEHIGVEMVQNLRFKANQAYKFTKSEKEELYDQLKELKKILIARKN